jgi:hypothetical protein
VIAIHAAFVVAVHVQSRLVEIASVPDIPSEGIAPSVGFWTLTSHLRAVGAVTDMAEDDSVHALASQPSAQSANSRARIAVERSASFLPSAGGAVATSALTTRLLNSSQDHGTRSPPTTTVAPLRTARGSAGKPAAAWNLWSNAFSTVMYHRRRG